AVAVLEVEPVVLDRLVLQLGHHALEYGFGQAGGDQSHCVGENPGLGRMLIEVAPRELSQLAGRVGLEEMGAAVDGVGRLAIGSYARMVLGEACRGGGEAVLPGP